MRPSCRGMCACGAGGGTGETRARVQRVNGDTPCVASHPRLLRQTRASRRLGASQPGLVAQLGSPAVPGLAGVWAAASVTPSRSGPACPVHLNKLRLTGAQSLWSRRPPVASLPPQLPRAESGQLTGMGRGTREEPAAGPPSGRGVAADLC